MKLKTDFESIMGARIEEITRGLPEQTNLVVPRHLIVDSIPHRRSRRGRAYGALRQYRCARALGNVHIKEYPDRFVLHVDAYNPHHHLLSHLLVDRGYEKYVHVLEFLVDLARVDVPIPVAQPDA